MNGHAVKTVAKPSPNPPSPIDKSQLTLSEPRRFRNKAHLNFVASQPCLVCGRRPVEAHHLTYTQPKAMGRKVSDEFAVPLCAGHHRELHNYGDERKWWEKRRIDSTEAARDLWEITRSRKREKLIKIGAKIVSHGS